MTTRCRQSATASLRGTAIWGASALGLMLVAILAPEVFGASPNRWARRQEVQAPVPSDQLLPTPAERIIRQDGSPQQSDDMEVLMRGPLHEAFASVHQDNPVPGPVIYQRPPDPINEALPEFKPEGQNVLWIQGYWGWDEVASQFIWISGLWRDIPLGQRWVPGYWEEVQPGYRWVSGFWTRADVDEIAYLPAPPASLDVGPSSAPPGEQYFYTPGNWVYRFNVYQWQPGYWQPYIENWVWVPAHYIWTPCGYVFCAGYWDRLFQERGVCFAPVRFIRPIYYGPQFFYRPACRIVTGIGFYVHLFVRPSCGRYYFGDWYGDPFAQREFCAWVHYPSRYRCYDPLYSYYRCSRSQFQNTLAITWIASQHQQCEGHADYRPPHVYKAGFDHARRDGRDRVEGGPPRIELVEDIEQSVAREKDGRKGNPAVAKTHYRRLNEVDRQDVLKAAEPLREIERSRRMLETQQNDSASLAGGSLKRGKSNDRADRSSSQVKMKLPKTDQAVIVPMDGGGVTERRTGGPAKADVKKDQLPTLSDSGDRRRATPKIPGGQNEPNGVGQGDAENRSRDGGNRPPKQDGAPRVRLDGDVQLPGTEVRETTQSDATVISETGRRSEKSDSGSSGPKRGDQNARRIERATDSSGPKPKLEVHQIEQSPQMNSRNANGIRGDMNSANRANKSDDKGGSRQESIRQSPNPSSQAIRRSSGKVESLQSATGGDSKKADKPSYRANSSGNGIAERVRQVDSQTRRLENSAPKFERSANHSVGNSAINSAKDSGGQRNREVNSSGSSSSDSNRGSEPKRGRDKPGKE